MRRISLLFVLFGACFGNPTEPTDDGYYMLDGKRYSVHLTEDDFALAAELDFAALARNRSLTHPRGGGMKEPEFVWDEEKMPGFEPKKGHFTVSGMWKSQIPYMIEGFDATDRAAIAQSIGHLQSVSGLKFTGGNAGSAKLMKFVQSSNTNGVCSTSFAFNSFEDVKAEVALPPRSLCTSPRTIIHEIFHGLGHYHTHQRPDRDSHVTINYGNFDSWNAGQFDKCTVPAGQSDRFYCNVYGQPYECDSVMHYAYDQFSNNGQPTMVAKDPSRCQLLSFGAWNERRPYLSAGDTRRLQEQYPKRSSQEQDEQE